MATYSNSALAQSLAPFYGSCKLEISEDSGSTWVNVGLARGVTFNETMERANIQADNGPDISEYVATHEVEITFNGLEFYLPTLNKLRGGIDTLSASSAVATTDTDVYTTGAKSYSVPIYLQNQGDSSTLPAISKVASVSTGNSCTTYESTKDYTSFTDAAENSVGIVLLSTDLGGTFKDSEALKIKYAYGDVQKYKLSSGGLSTITAKWFRLTNKQIVSGTAKYRYFVLYSASLNAGLNLAFKSSNDADPILEIPISLIARIDASRTAGDQLYYIEDEVATA